MDLGVAISAAVDSWERDTLYKPFKVEAADTTRYFSPLESWPNGILNLRSGYISITSITTGLSATELTGTVLTVDVDYWLEPMGTDGPYNYVRFASYQSGVPKSIKIIGKRGYNASEIPAEAWLAVANRAALECAMQTSAAGASSIKQGPVTISGEVGSLLKGLDSQYKQAVGRYTRVSL